MSIRQAQKDLILLGYGRFLRPYGADGYQGTKTMGATRRFQIDYNKKFNKNILVDGLIGKQVRNALKHWKSQVGIVGTRNFNIREFYSKDGSGLLKGGMDNKLILRLEQLRYNLGDRPMIITSGYRSPAHNRRVGGAKRSQHLYGRASDIQVRGVSAGNVYREAIKLFDGVGRYRTFTHVDTRGYKARF